jgi:polyhydroxybutyrate depolymerase
MMIGCSAPEPHGDTVDASMTGGDPGDAPVSTDGSPSAACTGKTAQPLDATWTVTVGGMARTARVHVPATYAPTERTPVVINIHGLTGSASGQSTLSHLIAKSDAAGFISVHPEGTGSPRSWNAGGCCDPAAANDIDDVGFIEALIDTLEDKLCTDPDRVYAMGLSNGGHMSYRLACELSDRIAAVGPVAGLLHTSPCQPSRPVPVIHVHGTSDSIVGYAYVPAAINFWRGHNGCTSQQTTYQQGDATCVTHGGCTGAADVTLCTIAGGGHQWPGGDAIPFLGTKSNDLIATDAVWDFFVAHPRS